MRDEAARALAVPEVANGLHVGTLPGSDADVYSRIVGNAAETVGDAFFPSRADIVRTNFKVEEQWRRAGGRPTHQPEQGEPVRSYYKRVERAGDIVGYNRIMVTDQFYRGLLPENVIEASRIGAAPLNILIDRLSDLERRKGEMFYGLQRRQGIEKAKKEELAGYTHPVTPHEGAVMQRSTDVITQKNYKNCLRHKPRNLPRISRRNLNNYKHLSQFVNHRSIDNRLNLFDQTTETRFQDPQDPDWDDGYIDHDVGDDPDAPEWTSEDDQHVIDLIMGYETSKRFPKRLQKAKDRRDDLELARAMRNLDLNDDAMDIDTNTTSFDDLKIVPDEEGGFRIFKMTPIKIPVKVTSSKPTLIKAVTKMIH
ncbi:hypothetical protein GLOIN_2v1790588 [Rhizophagus irregularis DAOM 181602=DAOM 197198]|nr:hypothetical protein GLOIN_2v1790588 [Rhizophagus irregularis DAOM 181602=DAOM 197198]